MPWLYAIRSNTGYSQSMAEVKKLDFNQPAPIFDEEVEATLAEIDRGIKAADEGRVVPLEEVRQRMQEWLTKSSSPTTP
jgi:predicted transcriptional regulator